MSNSSGLSFTQPLMRKVRIRESIKYNSSSALINPPRELKISNIVGNTFSSKSPNRRWFPTISHRALQLCPGMRIPWRDRLLHPQSIVRPCSVILQGVGGRTGWLLRRARTFGVMPVGRLRRAPWLAEWSRLRWLERLLRRALRLIRLMMVEMSFGE